MTIPPFETAKAYIELSYHELMFAFRPFKRDIIFPSIIKSPPARVAPKSSHFPVSNEREPMVYVCPLWGVIAVDKYASRISPKYPKSLYS